MANVNVHTYKGKVPQKVTKTITKTEYVDKQMVNVTVPLNTARLLTSILVNVGGVPGDDTPRGAVSELLKALNGANAKRFGKSHEHKSSVVESGSIILTPEWPDEVDEKPVKRAPYNSHIRSTYSPLRGSL